MSTAIDAMYRMRDMAGVEADKLKASIASAQEMFDKLDKFADDMEKAAELLWESQQPKKENPDERE